MKLIAAAELAGMTVHLLLLLLLADECGFKILGAYVGTDEYVMNVLRCKIESIRKLMQTMLYIIETSWLDIICIDFVTIITYSKTQADFVIKC